MPPARCVPRRRGDEPLSDSATSRRLKSVPRRRGDEPYTDTDRRVRSSRVPRRRGDEPRDGFSNDGRRVFPADAGMNRPSQHAVRRRCEVFPADAGMNRRDRGAKELGHGVPRRRGDEPFILRHSLPSHISVPRRRGDEPPINSACRRRGSRVPRRRGDEPYDSDGSNAVSVFPADAGMNRTSKASWTADSCVPRRRGDEPKLEAALELCERCSPQTRG